MENGNLAEYCSENQQQSAQEMVAEKVKHILKSKKWATL